MFTQVPKASGTSVKPSKRRHTPAKKTRNRVPPPQRIRIMQKYAAGESIVQIGREEKRNRESIARIVNGDEMKELVRIKREELYGLADSALAALRHGLAVQKDGRLAFLLLTRLGIVPSEQEREAMAASAKNPQDDETASLLIAMRLFEGALHRQKTFGIDTIEKARGKFNAATGRIEPKPQISDD
jgi:hypothetical protein